MHVPRSWYIPNGPDIFYANNINNAPNNNNKT